MSARLKRLDSVVRSGPIPSPSLPNLWHLTHWAFSKTSRPLATSPLRPLGSFSRKVSRSSNLYFDSAALAVATAGRVGSLGKAWPNQRDQDSNSDFQSPSSAPKCLSLLQCRSNRTTFQRF